MDQAIEHCPLFSGMTAEEARRCLACSGAAEERHAKDGLVFCESDTPRRLYVLLEGAVCVCRDSAEGRRAVLDRIHKPGELFGEVYVFLGQKNYGFCVQAETAVRLLAIPGKFFYATCEKNCPQHARLIRNMLSIFARKAFFLARRVCLLSSGGLRRRIAALLLEHCMPDGKLDLDMNREQMADFLGVARPSLSRELAAMRDAGLLEIRGRSLKILDRQGLRELCDYFFS